jgi:hypothetical protein
MNEETVMYIIRNGSDARAICEILAVNGYKVKSEVDKESSSLRFLVYVEGGNTGKDEK